MYRSPQARNQEGANPPLEKFSSRQEKCVGQTIGCSFKKMSPS